MYLGSGKRDNLGHSSLFFFEILSRGINFAMFGSKDQSFWGRLGVFHVHFEREELGWI